MPDSPPDGSDPTEPDISLHRAGLMPAEGGDGSDREFEAFQARADAVYLKYKLQAEQSKPAPAGADASAADGAGDRDDHDES